MTQMKEIDLYSIVLVIKKQMWVILSICFIALGLTGIYTYVLTTPTYQSSTQLLVTLSAEDESKITMDGMNVNLSIINTYKDFAKNGGVIPQEVHNRLKGTIAEDLSVGRLASMISVDSVSKSQMLTLTATAVNPAVAALVANTTTEVFKEESDKVMGVDKLSIIKEAGVPTSPSSPNSKRDLFVGVFIGFLVGVLLGLVLEYMDATVKSEADIENLSLVIVGQIAEMQNSKDFQGLKKKKKRKRHKHSLEQMSDTGNS